MSDIDLATAWHVPIGEELDAAAGLLEEYCVKAMEDMREVVSRGKDGSLEVWRRRAKNLEYAVRGAVEVLNDDATGDHPHELSVKAVVAKAGPVARRLFESLRTRIVEFIGENVRGAKDESGAGGAKGRRLRPA